MFQNAMIYNKPNTVYFKTAQILLKDAEELFSIASSFMNRLKLHKRTGFLDVSSDIFHRGRAEIIRHKAAVSRKKMPAKVSRTTTEKVISSTLPSSLKRKRDHQMPRYSSIAELLRKQPRPKLFQYGDLVWAKITGFPWYPSEVVDPATESIHHLSISSEDGQTDDKLDEKRTNSERAPSYLVMFFDRPEGKRTYTWLAKDLLFPLNANSEYDKLFLNYPKRPHQRKAVRYAYAQALKENQK
jgi:hypothetical protein